MKNLPLVSVIINCFNSEQFLQEAIDSVYSQSYSNWEIVFWDNASTDNSAAIAKNNNFKLRYYCSDKNTTLGEARRRALAKANGKYVCFLDCDDIILERKLTEQVEILEKGDAFLVYGGAIIIDENGKEIDRKNVKNFTGNMIERLLYRYDINMQTVMFNSAVFNCQDIFIDGRLKYSPDYNLFMKISSIYPVIAVDRYFAKYRVHSGALSPKLLEEVSLEGKITLDYIFNKFDDRIKHYKKAKLTAYRKLRYYDAIHYININDYNKAKTCIKKIYYSNIYYYLLYILLLLKVKREIILKLLNR